MKRTIEISTRGTRLFLDAGRLVVHRDDEDLARIPLEDLGAVVLDSTGISISSGALKSLAEHGCTVLACDDSHHPNGLFLPLDANSLLGERIRFQADAGEALKKNLWARIVRRKILNQAIAVGGKVDQGLIRLAGRVKSGDGTNCEAQAAKLYWLHFFADCNLVEQPFRRFREGPPPNALLNYGYSIIRALLARCLCSSGLFPALGIHHCNRYNGFALVDDVMEPFRPVVDVLVKGIVRSGSLTIHKETKQRLLELMEVQVLWNGESVSVQFAAERVTAGLAKALIAGVRDGVSAPKAAEELVLPELMARKGA